MAIKQERGYDRPPSLDLEVTVRDDMFPDRAGYYLGRQVLWLGIGVPLAVFTGGAWAVIGYLMAVIGVLKFAASVVSVVMLMRGRPYRGWRLGSAALAIGVVPLACLWPSSPVQRITGVGLPLWLGVLASTLAALSAVVIADRRSRGIAVYRMKPPRGDDPASIAWLDERITYLESLPRARRVFAPERRHAMRALGNACLTRFAHPAGGQVADLHRATDIFKSVAAATPAGARDEPGVYHDLANALSTRAMLEFRGEDIEEALALLRTIGSSELGKRLPERERDWAERRTYELLWARLRTAQALQLPRLDDAVRQEAIDELTAMAAQDRPDYARARILMIIAEFHLLWIYPDTRGPAAGPADIVAHMDQAIDALRGADALMTVDNPDRHYAQALLANVLAARARARSAGILPAGGADQDHEEAKRYLLLAMADPAIARRETASEISGSMVRVLEAASLCVDAELSRGGWQEATRIGRLAVGLLESLVRTAIFRRSREDALRVGSGLHGKVGYAMAMGADDQPHALLAAIRLIESGRAVLLREALGRSELSEQADRLRAAGHAALAAEVAATLSRVAELEAIELSAHDTEGRAVRRVVDKAGLPLRDAIGAAQADIARLRPQIDAVLGADDAQAPEDNVAAAAVAPLCYLLHVSRGADGIGPDLPGLALIVSVSSGAEPAVRVRTVSLPGVTGSAIEGWHDRWQGSHGRPTLRTGDLVQLGRLFQELGKNVVEPAFSAAGRPARLTLLPDGLLSMLPLHAATVPDGNGAPRPLCQHVVVGYAPTAAVLRSCQDRAGDIGQPQAGRLPARFLGIAVTAGELRGASPELHAAARYFDAAEIIDDGAPGQRVLAALAANARAAAPLALHFACHARAEVGDPLSSVIEVASGPEGQVRLADLLTVGLGSTRIAVLSACETGALGSADPDQFVSLATGFVQIGAAGVIGTLSRVADPVALALTRRFYQEWAALPADPAMALSAAQHWLATADPTALAAALDDAYPGLSPMDLAQYTHPAHWAPFFFLGA